MKTTRTYSQGCTWCNATGTKYPMQNIGTSFSSICPVCNGNKTIIVTEVTESDEPKTNPMEQVTEVKELKAELIRYNEFIEDYHQLQFNIGTEIIDKFLQPKDYISTRDCQKIDEDKEERK